MTEKKFFSLPAAAGELGVCNDVLREQYRSGHVPALKTPKGQPRFSAETIESIKQHGWPQPTHSGKNNGKSQGPAPQRAQEPLSESQVSDVLRAEREEVAHDQLGELRQAEAMEAAQQRERAQFEHEPSVQIMRAEEHARLRRESEQRRRQLDLFYQQWTDQACRQLPCWLTPEQRADVARQIEREIRRRVPEDDLRMYVVCGEVVRTALLPFNRLREISQARDAALVQVLAKLPPDATDSEKMRARSVARKAIQELGEEPNGDALLAAARDAIAPIVAEIEFRGRREKLRAWGLQKVPFAATEGERREIRGAITQVLEQIRTEQEEAEIRDKIAESLEPILAAIPRRVEEERRCQRIAGLLSPANLHVGTYLNKLHSEGELSYEAICDWEWRRELEGIVDAELRKELSGDETSAKVRELVEEILDDQLDGDDDDKQE